RIAARHGDVEAGAGTATLCKGLAAQRRGRAGREMSGSLNSLFRDEALIVHAFADGELSKHDLVQFRDHLDMCANCLAEYTRICALKTVLKTEEMRYHAPGRLRSRIAAEVRAESQKARSYKNERRLTERSPHNGQKVKLAASALALAASIALMVAIGA